MQRQKRFLLLLVLFFVIIQSGLAASYEGYRLNIDDQLYISVWGHSDLQREVLIGPDGTISFPLIGEVYVLGLNIDELNEVITERLSQYILGPRVNVWLSKYRGLQVLVLGEAAKPGTYQVNAGSRVLDAISLAGGPTVSADLESINLTRSNEPLKVNLSLLLRGFVQEQNYLLQSGDIIFIPRSTIDVTILGEVRQQGTYQVKRDACLSELIAKAGGLLDDAGNELLVRRGEEVKNIDVRDIFSGNIAANLPLQEGDSVFVPKVIKKVAILGEVAKPGTYAWYEGLNLVDLLAQAGNATVKADKEKVRQISFDGEISTVNVEDYLRDGNKEGNPALQAGDIIIVGEAGGVDWEAVFFFVRGFSAIKDLLGIRW